MMKAYPLARGDRTIVEQADSAAPAATPNPDRCHGSAEKLFLLFCQSKCEMEKLDQPDRKLTIRGDLVR